MNVKLIVAEAQEMFAEIKAILNIEYPLGNVSILMKTALQGMPNMAVNILELMLNRLINSLICYIF